MDQLQRLAERGEDDGVLADVVAAANRVNAYGTYLLMERELLRR